MICNDAPKFDVLDEFPAKEKEENKIADISTENAISQSLPCAKLIEIMNLRQQQEDGFYYDSNGMLAAFDTDLTQRIIIFELT